MAKPRYQHDCAACIFVGQDGLIDMYCHPYASGDAYTFLRRYSSVPEDYSAIDSRVAQGEHWDKVANAYQAHLEEAA